MLVCCLHVPTVDQRTAVSNSVTCSAVVHVMHGVRFSAHAKYAESAYIDLRRTTGAIPAISHTQNAAC